MAPRKTALGSLERALRALHAHIFFIKIGPIGADYNGLKGTKENKNFSLTIFFSETIAPRKTGLGSLERALRALHAHIFFIKIGPIGAESRVITEPSYNGLKGTKENKNFSLTIFFSETIAPRKTGLGSLERALRALHAHIFFIKIGPIGAESRVIAEPSYNGLKGTKENKNFSLTIFFSETIAPRKTVLGSLERALRALHAHIFFIKIGPIGADTYENRTGVIGKGSSRPTRPYFFYQDRTNRSRVITEPSYNGLKGTKEKEIFSLTIFFSETIAPRKTGLGSLERALRALHAHIFFIKIGPIGADIAPRKTGLGSDQWEPSYNVLKGTKEKENFSLTIFFSETIAPRKTGLGSRVITEPSYNGLKGTKEKEIFPLTIFFSETIAPRKTGLGSLERALRALHAHIFFIKIGPIGAESRVITEPSYNGLKGTKENKNFSLTIFFSETIAPRKTGLESLERALRALHAHIFFIKIGPIGAESRVITEPSYNGLKGTKERENFSLTIFFSETIAPRKTGLGSLERALRALHAHIFFIKIGPIGADYNGLKRPKENKNFSLTIFFSETIAPRKTGLGSLERALRSLHAHIFFEPSYNGFKGTKEKEIIPLTIFFSETIAPRKTGLGSLERALRALHAHIFFIKIGPIGADYNGLKGTKEKENFSLTIFFSETIAPRKTGLGSLERALRALHAHIFFIKIGPIGADYNGLKGTKENKNFSLTIFFSETIAPRKTGLGSLERALRALHAHIFFIKIGPIGAESRVITEPSYNGLKGTKEKENFSLTIFFSETIAPRKTGLGSLERALRALHAHIFFIKIGPIGADGLKGTREKENFSLTIFFSETIAPRKTGLGSLERALRALHAHIFFIKIGPIGADYNGLKGTKENKNFSLTIFFSETIAPRKTGLGSLERALRALHAHIFFIKIGPIGAESRVITEPSYNGLKGTKEKENFSLTIFFSETIAPRKTGLGSLQRALRALHAHIFFIKIGPIGADGLKGTREKENFSLTIFFSETIAPRKTGLGSLERALRALHAHIFFIKIGPIGAESRVITEPSYNGLKGTKEKEIFSLTIFFSETIAPRKTGLGSLQRALRALHAHIFFIKIGPIGADYDGLKGTKENKNFSLTIFFSETIAPRKTGLGSLERALRALHGHIFFIKIGPIGAESRVITEPSYNGLKGTKEKENFSLTIFFSETIAPRKTGLGSLQRALRALHAHIFFIKIGPIGADYNGLKGTKENKNFSLTIFFSETIAPRKTGLGSLERALRALHGHIFFIKIGPIGAESRVITKPSYNGLKGTREKENFSLTIFFSETIAPRKTGLGSLERALRALHAHIFFIKIGPIGGDGLKGTKEKEIFPLTIFFSETIAPRKTALGSLERALRALHAHIFFIKIGPIGADYNGLKGTNVKEIFSLTIFFSETIAPRKTGLGSLERALRALHAHIFFIKIGPIGADTKKNRTGVIGKGSSRPTRPYFFYQDRTNRSRVITHLEKPDWGHWKGLLAPYTPIFFLSRSDQWEPSYNVLKGTKEKENFSLTIFFSETIAPRKTGLGSLERALRALHAHIFFIKIGPIGAESRVITEPSYNGLKGTKENKNFSLTIFFSETIAPRKTGLESLERALRALHAHIFFIKIGPIGAESRVITEPSYNGLKGTKENKNFSLTIFFSETIAPRKTGLESLERALRALHAHIFFIKIGPIGADYNGLKGTKVKEIFSLTIFFSETIAPRKTGLGSLERALRALHAHIFFIKIGPIGAESRVITEPSYNGLKGTKENKNFSLTIFFSETIAPRKTGLESLERALRALHAHIFFIKIGPIGAESRVITEPSYNGLKGTKERENFSLTIFFSETIAPRKTGLGSLERALRALHAHIFFIKIGPIGADYNGLKRPKENKNFSLTIFFSETIAPRKTGLGSLERALRSLHAHIFFEPSYNGFKGTNEKEIFPLTIFFSETIAPRKTGLGSLERALRALHAHIFFIKIGPIGAESRVITEPSYNGLKGTKEKENFSLTIFFSETIAPRKTGLGSLERALRALHAHIFFIKIGPIGADGLKGTREKENFSLTIFFSETIAPRKTGLGSLERALRALHAHIFFIKIGPIGAESRVITEPSYNGLKGTKEKENFSLTIFFSETIAPRKTGLGSLERALRALHAHIFFMKIGPIGADGLKGTREKENFSLTIFFSETIAPRKTGLGSLERALRALHAHIFFIKIGPIGAESRVITEPSYNGLKGTKEKEIFSLTIFFSETIAPRKTGLGSLERALRALHAHIFFIKIGPIGAESRVITEPSYDGLKGTKENKNFSLTIFFSETIAPRKTGLGSLERALRALHGHIFFIKIGPIGAESRVITKPSYNGLKGTREKENFSLTIFFSETIAPRKTGLGSLERALRALHAHIFFIKIGPIGGDGLKGTKEKEIFPLTIFFSETIAPRKTALGSLERALRALHAHIFFIKIGPIGADGLKGTKEKEIFPLTIFFSETIAPRKTGLGSLERALRALHAHIFFIKIGPIGADGLKGTKEKEIFPLTIFFSETIAPRKTGLGSLERALRALHAHIFFIKIGPIGADTQKNRTGVIGKGSSRPTRPYFFYQDRTNKSRVITEPSYNGLKGTKVKEIFSLTIFFSETIAPRKTGLGSLERALRALHAHIFFIKIGPIGAEKTGLGSLERALRALHAHIFFKPSYNGLKGTREKENFSLTIFFSETIAPRKTGLGSLERALRALHAHIFLIKIGPIGGDGLKGTKEKEIFPLTIFFSETIAPRKTALGSLERALRALHAHIFFIKIGPIGADGLKGTKEKEIFPLTIFFSETIAPRKTGLGSLERALRALHAHIFFIKIGPIGADYNGLKGTKEKEIFSLTIFFSETIAPRKTGLGSLERALRALHAHIFFIKIGPIEAEEKENFSLTIFFSETIAPRKTGLGSLERALRALHAHIFFIKIGPIGGDGLKGTKEKEIFPLTIFFSETIAPRKTALGSLERALRALHAHIFFIKIGPIGADGLKGTKEKEIFPLTIFFSETIAPRKTGLGSLERALRALHAHIFFIKIGPIGADGLKGTKEKEIFPLTIFFSETIAPRKTGLGSLERALRALHMHIFFIKIGPIGADTQKNRTGVIGKGSSRPTRPYFFYQDRTNKSRVITEPSYNGLKGTKVKEIFSLTIFFSETIAPRKTGLGSLERALRALHAHIFFIKIGPIGAEKTGLGSLERALRALHAHIFFKPSYNGLKGTREKENFSLTIFFSETIAPRKTGLGSLERALRALHAHIFLIKIGPIGGDGLKGTKEKEIFPLTIFFSETIAPRKTALGSLERALRALHAHIFFIKIGPIGADGLKGTKEKEIFPLTIFFSETIAPRKTGLGSLERALRALHAHIFFIKIGPIGADYNGLKGTKEKEIFSLTIFFSETVAPRKTGLGSLERALRALHAHIFFIKIGPIRAESRVITEPSYNGLKGTKEKKIFSLTIFFSETIAPRKTGLGSLERALRALHAHIFLIKIGPIGGDGLKGTKEKEIFPLTIFFSETIAPRKTALGSLERALRALHAHIFFIKIGPIGADGLKGTKEKEIFPLTIFFSETIAPRKTGLGSLERALRALHAHIFFIKIGPIGADGLKGTKEKEIFPLTIFFSETIAPRKTGLGSLERALRALHAHIFFIKIGPIGADYNGLKGTKEKEIFSLTIFFSETVAPRKTGLGSLERALRALHAHIFFIKIGPIRAEKTGLGSLERALRALHAHIFFIKIGPIGAESRVITEPSYNGLKGTKEKKIFSLTIFFSETIAPRKTGLGSLERSLRDLHAHEPSYNGLKGTKEKEIFSLTIFFSETIAPRKTGLGSLERSLRALHAHEPSYNGLKGTKEKEIFPLTIFFSETIAPRKTALGSLERALRALHAHIFFIKIGPIGADGLKGTKEKEIFPLTIFFSETIAPRKTGLGSLERALRALHAHIFLIKIGPIGGDGLKGTKEKEIFPLTIFFSETIAPRKTALGSLERALRALHAHIFFIKIGPIGADGLKGTKEKEIFPLTIFFSETIAPRKTGLGSLERALRALHAHIFFIKIGPIGADYNGLKGTKEKEIFSLTIFFSETVAPRKTGLGSLERALRALHAHIFFIKIGPIRADYNGLKGTKKKEIFSLTIFFSETIAPRKTGLGSLERALRALHAHIFFIKIGPIGADYNGLKGTKEKKIFSLTIFFSETIAPRKTGLGSLERSLRDLHAHEPSYNGLKGTKEKEIFSLTIFFSETIAPRKTGLGSLERSLRALHAHEPSYNGLKGTKEKQNFSLTIFFSETIAPRKTGLRPLERALRVLHAHIFFIKIGPIGAESRVITKPSYNGLKGTREKENFSLTIFFSETIAPRKTGLGSLERALRALHAHIILIKIGPIGGDGLKGTKEKEIFPLTIFFSETIAPRKTALGSLERALRALHAHIFFIKIGPIGADGLKGTKEKEIFPLAIFFSETIAPRKTGLGSLERALRALHAHIFFIKIGPIGADGLKGTKEKEISPLTIFFSETIAPRKTGLGSLERALRALHAHIFFIKIGPIGAESRVITEPSYNGLKGTKEKKIFSLTIFFSETIAPRKTGLGSLERSLRDLYAHEPSYNGLKGTKEKEIFSLTIFFSETIAPRKTGLGSLERSLRALHAHEPSYNGLKGTKEKQNFSLTIFFSETIAPRKTGLRPLERALRVLHAHIFFIKIGPIGAESRVITEPSYNGLKGTKEKEIFSLTIFFSETIEPRKTGLGSLKRALRVLHAHIFFIKIGPIGADTWKNRTWVIGKGSSRHTRPYFFYQDRTNRSRVITEPSYNGLKGTKEKEIFSLTIFFSETIEPRKTGLGSLKRALREPSYNGLKGTKEKKNFSLTIFFSETIAPGKTGLGSLERALRAIHAHIFFIKIGPIGAEL
ncbi:LOW QUALITY PROTEIN: hypothetical protein V1477_006464 [Vespula maculifrons]|uniref:Uncharacterized protein n=1 Tax=Vespula maculifrons TaxID=7453 RepID=A0ABD2CJP2_VESMC